MLVREVCEEAILALDSDIGLATAARFLNSRYAQLASRVRLRHLRRVGEVVVPPNIVAGTIDLTSGSDEVAGDPDALAAWNAVGADRIRGRFLQVRSNWHEIAELTPTGLRLRAPYTDVTQTGASYTIIERYIRLDKDVVWIGPFAFPRLRRMLYCSSQDEIDHAAPGRVIKSGGPQVVLQAPNDPVDGRIRVELYPPPGSNRAELLRYIYWAKPPQLTLDQELPSGLDPQVLKEGIIIDLLRRQFATALAQDRVDAAATYRNEFNTQRTVWHRDFVNLAGIVDCAIPDDSAILLLGSSTLHGDFDPVATARADVYSEWEGLN